MFNSSAIFLLLPILRRWAKQCVYVSLNKFINSVDRSVSTFVKCSHDSDSTLKVDFSDRANFYFVLQILIIVFDNSK